jgi:hypothetical protein
MKKFDKLFSVIVVGYALLIFPFLLLWWGCYLLNINILIGVTIGLLIGITLNILLYKKIVTNFYKLSNITLILLFIFYTIGIFGFFMGVPVFNILPGILAGMYIGRKAHNEKESNKNFKKKLFNINIFSTIILLFICFCSAFIALSDKTTAVNLEGMFNLNFHITNTILWEIILIGGTSLVILQYIFSTISANITYRKNI